MKKLTLITLLTLLSIAAWAEQPTLAERLGYKKTDRLLIINSDDAGMCHSANTAIMRGMEKGIITSTTIMPPCGWFNEMASFSKQLNRQDRGFGIHLTLTAEWRKMRWSTVAPRNEVKGLYDAEGYMHLGVDGVYKNASPEEAIIEGRAQIKKVLDAGVPVTHLDNHMGSYQYKLEFMEAYLELAKEFDYPVRMAPQYALESRGFPHIRNAFDEAGILMPDDLINLYQSKEYGKEKTVKEEWMRILKEMKPGVNELFIHANDLTDEIINLSGTHKIRAEEAECFTSDPDIQRLIKEEGIILITYQPLLDLQRKSRK